MSNEKLGAEQGREFDFEAIGDAIDRVLAGQRELTPAEQKNLRGIYSKLFTKLKPEQAYHAHGAGREDPKCPFCGTIGDHDCERQHGLPEVSIQRPLLLSEHVNKSSEFFDAWVQGLLGQVSLVEALARLIAQIEHRVKAEPGADTGTTPPSDVCPECTLGPPNWADRKEGYCAFCNDTGNRPQVKPAERGTTPPEGLAFTFEEFIDMSLRHNKRLAAGISGIASFGHWYNEMLAATQRAPVEHK